MTVSEPSTYRISAAERENFRALYATGLYTLTELATDYGRSREMVRRACLGIARPTMVLTAGVRNTHGPQPPSSHVGLPTVLLSQRQRVGARLWWPSLPQTCQHPLCRGRLLVRPADADDGAVSCHLCAREVAVVGREKW